MAEYQLYHQRQNQFTPPDRTSSSSSTSQLHSVRKGPSKPWRSTAKPLVSHRVPGAGDSRPSAYPPKIYRVDPRGFRQLVQRLTGASSAANNPVPQQSRLRDAAPTPLQLFRHTPGNVQQHMFFPPPAQYPLQNHYEQYPAGYPPEGVRQPQIEPTEVVTVSDDNDTLPASIDDLLPQPQKQLPLPSPTAKVSMGCPSPNDWATLLSPSTFSAWCSFPLLSPGSMTPLETSTVN